MTDSELNSAQQCFMQILSDYLFERNSMVNTLYADEICFMAKSHQLSPIVYYQTKLSCLRESYFNQVSDYAKRRNAIGKFEAALDKTPHLFFKGAIVAELYQQPALRSMGDVDVLIFPEDRNSVHELLLGSGFDLVEQSGIVWTYSKSGIKFEVHTKMIHPSEGNEKIESYFLNPWEHIQSGVLDWNYHYVYLLAHLRHHMATHGAGFRQFIDLAIVARKCNLDWTWIFAETEKLGLKSYLINNLALVERWFDILSPVNCDLNDTFYEQATQYIFANGVFGDDNPDNGNYQLTEKAINTGMSSRYARIKLFFSQLFPKYESMINLPYCSYIKEHKWLLPIAWIRRSFYKVFNKESREAFINRIVVKDEGAEKKIELLQQWGL